MKKYHIFLIIWTIFFIFSVPHYTGAVRLFDCIAMGSGCTEEPSLYIPPTPQTWCEKINNMYITGILSYNDYPKARIAAGCDGNTPIPTREKDQTCQNFYGLNSGWTGKNNEDNGPICDCMTGYQYENNQKICALIIPPPVEISTEIQAPLIEVEKLVNEEVPPQKIITAPTKKLSKETLTATTTAIIAPSSFPSTTPKEAQIRQGFWTRVIRWFGF